MKVLKLKRIAEIDDATFGVLLDDSGIPFCLTGERIWANNNPDVSCIPFGEYLCKKHYSPKFGFTYEVMGVIGRDNILFHKGNIPDVDSHGCILLGEQFGVLNERRAVLASGEAFTEFTEILRNDEEFRLVIVNA